LSRESAKRTFNRESGLIFNRRNFFSSALPSDSPQNSAKLPVLKQHDIIETITTNTPTSPASLKPPKPIIDHLTDNVGLSTFGFTIIETPKNPSPLLIYLATKKKYKPITLKVKPVIGELLDKLRIIQNTIGDPLQDLLILLTKPPTFTLTGCYTQEHKDLFDKLNPGFLLPAERDLLHYFMMIHNNRFAWEILEQGHFREDFFPPINILVILHKPWVQCNILIPPGLYDELCQLVKDKIDTRVFEPLNSSYQSE
jgi:hypothetical protein